LNPAFLGFCDKEQEFVDNGKKVKRKALDSEVMTKMISECSLTDLAGALVTRGRSVGRKSIVEFGWVVGLPEDGDGQPLTTTEQYFHVKYAPEGRGSATGGDSVAGKQAKRTRIVALVGNTSHLSAIWVPGLESLFHLALRCCLCAALADVVSLMVRVPRPVLGAPMTMPGLLRLSERCTQNSTSRSGA
jgi:CRISPR-associated negative auto-regulator DevR/Csa2